MDRFYWTKNQLDSGSTLTNEFRSLLFSSFLDMILLKLPEACQGMLGIGSKREPSNGSVRVSIVIDDEGSLTVRSFQL